MSDKGFFEELAAQRAEPLHILHGTDWWTDCDDIVALRLLCRAHRAGAIVLECVCADAVMKHTAASIDAFIMNEGLEIPVGIDKTAVDTGEKCHYQRVLAKHPHRIDNEDCEDAVTLYRRRLASLKSKAVITEVGFPQIIHRLLLSAPDEISPLSGAELVGEKVEKIFMMAGKWDVPEGREYNLVNTPAARLAGSYICKNSPVPVVFLGFEVGETVFTGGELLGKDDMLREGMEANGNGCGRCSWDPMLALLAITNDCEKAGYKEVVGTARVNPETGVNSFSEHEGGSHSYVVKVKPDFFYSELINSLIK